MARVKHDEEKTVITNIRYAGVMVDDPDERLQIWKDLFDLEPVNEINTNQYGVRAQMPRVGESRSSR